MSKESRSLIQVMRRDHRDEQERLDAGQEGTVAEAKEQQHSHKDPTAAYVDFATGMDDNEYTVERGTSLADAEQAAGDGEEPIDKDATVTPDEGLATQLPQKYKEAATIPTTHPTSVPTTGGLRSRPDDELVPLGGAVLCDNCLGSLVTAPRGSDGHIRYLIERNQQMRQSRHRSQLPAQRDSVRVVQRPAPYSGAAEALPSFDKPAACKQRQTVALLQQPIAHNAYDKV